MPDNAAVVPPGPTFGPGAIDSPTPRSMAWRTVSVVGRALIRRALRIGLRLEASDATRSISSRSCLVLAPHPDDETFGCAFSLMHRRAHGARVTVVVVTDGAGNPPGRDAEQLAALRRSELAAATEHLGLDAADVRWLGFPDGDLPNHVDELAKAITTLITEISPDDVHATSPHDPHPDHAALGRAVHQALAGRSPRLLEYLIWQWEAPHRFMQTLRQAPVYVRDGSFRPRKLAAIESYRSQLGSPSDGGLPRGLLRACSARFELFFPVVVPDRPSEDVPD